MTIHPKDLRTLLLRVTAVTLAVRLVPLIGQDLGVHESALALGLSPAEHEPWTLLTRGFLLAGGGFGAFARLIPLLCEVASPALAVLLTRAAGWGALPGLLAGLLLAMGPLGLDMGERADGVALGTVATLAALGLARSGLQTGDWKRTALSALPILLAGILNSGLLILLPGALFLLGMAIADARVKRAGLIAWLLASTGVVAIRLLWVGHLVPTPPVSTEWWLTPASMDATEWLQTPLGLALLETLGALLPGGTAGQLARQLDLQPAGPLALALGGLLALAATVGLTTGRVRPDPQPQANQGELAGWQTLGLNVSVPRTLGSRDVVPLLLPVLLAMAWTAKAQHAGRMDGVVEVLAVARPCMALLLGVGLTALAMPKTTQDLDKQSRKTAWTLALLAALIFGLGAQHLLEQTRAPDRQAARKVAHFARDHLGQKGALLAIGGRGLPVLALLDPYLHEKRLAWTSTDPAEALSALTGLLAQKPPSLVLVGDRDALGPTEETLEPNPQLLMTWQMLSPTLEASGWQAIEDSHRFLGHTAVLAFAPIELPHASTDLQQ